MYLLAGQPPEKYCPTICSGDLVEVEQDVEIFRMMQEEHGGWNDEMANVMEVYTCMYMYHIFY